MALKQTIEVVNNKTQGNKRSLSLKFPKHPHLKHLFSKVFLGSLPQRGR